MKKQEKTLERAIRFEQENHDNRRKLINMIYMASAVDVIMKDNVLDLPTFYVVIYAFDKSVIYRSKEYLTEHAALAKTVEEIKKMRGHIKEFEDFLLSKCNH